MSRSLRADPGVQPEFCIDRRAIAEAWEATLRHGDQTVKLETNHLSLEIIVVWRAREKFVDDSPTAIAAYRGCWSASLRQPELMSSALAPPKIRFGPFRFLEVRFG